VGFVKWLNECSAEAFGEALLAVAPELTDRVMAWHLRNALGDALWRSEAGLPLADHRTPPEWVDDLAARIGALGIDP
jgi:hypothetical protein